MYTFGMLLDLEFEELQLVKEDLFDGLLVCIRLFDRTHPNNVNRIHEESLLDDLLENTDDVLLVAKPEGHLL